jgi:hypothetical protein
MTGVPPTVRIRVAGQAAPEAPMIRQGSQTAAPRGYTLNASVISAGLHQAVEPVSL